jgi:predicted enzyme related to lactoylglutathione lyase
VSSRFHALCIDASDPAQLADFWAEMLGVAIHDGVDDAHGAIALATRDVVGFAITFRAGVAPKVAKSARHFDLTSTSLDDQRSRVERAIALGARHIDVGQRPEEGHVVLADPEGNEFCVIEPNNAFLADCGLLGALACDGSQAVGYFWSEALHWPLVWDQNRETAVRSPRGGPKITWGGEEVSAQVRPHRLHFDIAVADSTDPLSEIDRLCSLGAIRLNEVTPTSRAVAMSDPDGNEFCVLVR